MNVGDELNGYRITTAPTNAGGGMSRWSFAERGGQEYFVKMFLAPRFPLPSSPGSELAKERRRAVCHEFERRHLEIARRLGEDVDGAANLVIPRDFFRVGTTYVKVMDRVRPSPLPALATLDAPRTLILVRSLVLSLRVLHRRSIVHGDLKPDNVMIQRRGEVYISKLIDFDEAYVVGDPPRSDVIVGDPAYYSPELLAYVKGLRDAGPTTLGLESDMFSLGLLLHLMLASAEVSFDRTQASYPAEVVLNGHELRLAPLPEAVGPMVAALLGGAPADRPTVGGVLDVLLALEPSDLAAARRTQPPAVVPAPVGPAGPGTVDPATPRPSPGCDPEGRPVDQLDRAGPRGLRSTMGRRVPTDPEEAP